MAARLLLLIGVALSVHAFVTTIALTQEPASPGAAAAQIPPTQAPLAQAHPARPTSHARSPLPRSGTTMPPPRISSPTRAARMSWR
jgi:hypothetical protein